MLIGNYLFYWRHLLIYKLLRKLMISIRVIILRISIFLELLGLGCILWLKLRIHIILLLLQFDLLMKLIYI